MYIKRCLQNKTLTIIIQNPSRRTNEDVLSREMAIENQINSEEKKNPPKDMHKSKGQNHLYKYTDIVHLYIWNYNPRTRKDTHTHKNRETPTK